MASLSNTAIFDKFDNTSDEMSWKMGTCVQIGILWIAAICPQSRRGWGVRGEGGNSWYYVGGPPLLLPHISPKSGGDPVFPYIAWHYQQTVSTSTHLDGRTHIYQSKNRWLFWTNTIWLFWTLWSSTLPVGAVGHIIYIYIYIAHFSQCFHCGFPTFNHLCMTPQKKTKTRNFQG